jgi:hypothetical protein
MDSDPLLTPTENKLAAIALLAAHGLSPMDAKPIVSMPADWGGTFDETPHINEFLDAELPRGVTHSTLALTARDALVDADRKLTIWGCS